MGGGVGGKSRVLSTVIHLKISEALCPTVWLNQIIINDRLLRWVPHPLATFFFSRSSRDNTFFKFSKNLLVWRLNPTFFPPFAKDGA